MSQTDRDQLDLDARTVANDVDRKPSPIGNVLGVAVCAIALGLLLWAKLQLVAGIPKTAVADPAAQGTAATTPGEQTGGRGDDGK